MSQTRILNLEKDVNYDGMLFRVEKGWKIRFTLEGNLKSINPRLYCDHPVKLAEKIGANQFTEFPWQNPNNCTYDYTDQYVEIPLIEAGVFKFYLVCDSEHKRLCGGSFIVDPELSIPGSHLNPDSIVLQTVLTKCLGPISEWKQRLEVSYQAGYNMLHFTPIQELGESNSSYSIKNHLRFDPRISDSKTTVNEAFLTKFISDLCSEWSTLSIIDIVLNHVANNSDWILEQPDCAYNLYNSCHLKPAFLVDRMLWYFNKEIMIGQWETMQIFPEITSEKQLDTIANVLRTKLDALKLYEFYVVNIEEAVKDLKILIKEIGKLEEVSINDVVDKLSIVQDEEYRRNGCKVDVKESLKYCLSICGPYVTDLLKLFAEKLDKLNKDMIEHVQSYHKKIVYNVIGHIRYHFLDENGPRFNQVTDEHSISVRYFSYPFDESSLEEDYLLLDSSKSNLIMAHNGWVMSDDALKNFAASDSNVYLCRELIAWGDSIKLRYGEKPDDCPYLWNMMKTYTQQMARIFHGFRLDNCHSTPIHVAEYLMACAREVNPNLYVIAELFTNNEKTDNLFINKLGLNSLIRENLGASSPRDLGRHVHRYGGTPVGSFIDPSTQVLRPSMAHALFMDVTHDNPSLFEVRSAFDILPSAALVSATCSGIGSNRGYDELVPHHINVVNECRFYPKWENTGAEDAVTLNSGILRAKKSLNELHVRLRNNGFTEVYVDQATEEITFVTRHSPSTHESVIFVTHAAFSKPASEMYPYCNTKVSVPNLPTLSIEGVLDEIVLEAQLFEMPGSPCFERNGNFLNGSQSYELVMQEHIPIAASQLSEISGESGNLRINFKNFSAGSVIVFKVSLIQQAQNAIKCLRSILSKFSRYKDLVHTNDHSSLLELGDVFANLTLVDLNFVLYRCNNEEQDDGFGSGVYDIPRLGQAVYAGLQGIVSILSKVSITNDLGHPICDNLRQGNWMLEYVGNRLKLHDGTRNLGVWFENVCSYLYQLPRYLIPSYFDAILSSVHEKCVEHAISKMSGFIQNGSGIVKSLSLGSLQMCGISASCKLPPISKSLLVDTQDYSLTMAAGLPHFSTGFMRCWGRDTFISLKGLLLVTGRHMAARNLILSFAGCIRHGLIPNLLAGGTNARFNARDATWFWLQAVQDYTRMVADGHMIMNCPVLRMYPNDNDVPQLDHSKEMMLQDVIHEILQCHFEGIQFTERNAGTSLDRDMTLEGFNQNIGVHLDTGFVFGGSEFNCGTWMDKMGSSTLASNIGHPATPRDGSAIELVGLCKSTLRWLIDMRKNGFYKYDKLTKHEGKLIHWTYEEWNEKIQENFEVKFFVDENDRNSFVHKRNIYKDSYLSSKGYTDYQLRPNFPIAMCVAPELFDHAKARKALSMIEKHLLGPVGIATLDPDDWAYNGFYENSIDNNVFNNARGFNYHQGPEWTWVLGPFLRAKLIFADEKDKADVVQQIHNILVRHYDMIKNSEWQGLPELTNKNGSYCQDSCPTQAWSMACLLEVLYDICLDMEK